MKLFSINISQPTSIGICTLQVHVVPLDSPCTLQSFGHFL